jgi:hypothetical protein
MTCPECDDKKPGAIRGLLIALPLGLVLWGVIVVCITWPLTAVAMVGLSFAAFCFWKAWKSWGA